MKVPIPVIRDANSSESPSKLKSKEIPKVGIHSCFINNPWSILSLVIKETKNINNENGNIAKAFIAVFLSWAPKHNMKIDNIKQDIIAKIIDVVFLIEIFECF